jgi:hypothetical protein
VEDTVSTGLENALDSHPDPGDGSGSAGVLAMVVDDHPLVRESMVTACAAWAPARS